MMNFHGAAKRLDDVDLPRLGDLIGVGEDEVHAVLDVESRGTGFDSKGRPAMLFEPHIFYKQLSGEQRAEAVRQGLAWKQWRRDYPKDSYPRLEKAMRINLMAALRSASWGLGQIMGFNAGLCGYDSALDMVQDFLDDEEKHLQAMVNFIRSAGLDDELREHDWAGFARGYNGPGYAKNGYDRRLRESYLKWSKIPDTEWKREQALSSALSPSTADIPEDDPTPALTPKTAPTATIGAGLAALGSYLFLTACKWPWLAWLFSNCGGN